MVLKKNTINNLFKGELPIGLWVPPPPQETSIDRYLEIKNAGFNFVIGLREMQHGVDKVKEALRCADKAGLKYIVNDLRMRDISDDTKKMLQELITDYSDYLSFIGNSLYDEPSTTQYNWLSEMTAALKEIQPEKIAYVNLFPTYSTTEQRGGVTYDEYVEEYIKKVKPACISFDHYPLLIKNEKNQNEISSDYFENLEIISHNAKKAGVPFWLFIQNMSFNNTHRDPTEEEIRWQVYMSLAFGAKGIQYFTYWTPPDYNDEIFGEAMIDRYGNRTAHYEEVCKINNEIKEIGKILLQSEFRGIICHGNAARGINRLLMDSFHSITSIKGDPLILGCFDNIEEGKYVLAVNPSYKENANVSLLMSNGGGNRYMWRNGIKREVKAESGSSEIRIVLAPGEGILLDIT